MERREARGGTLVLGGGFAGSYVARLLKRHGATIVSHENFMLYTPLLPEAASGTLEPRHVVVPLRQMCPHAELVLGDIARHDRARRSVVVRHARRADSRSATSGSSSPSARGRVCSPCPGLAEHGMGFKDLADAIALRNRVLLQLERATIHPDDPSELGFVFVGAGYAGVEALAELNDMAQAALRSYPALRETPAALGARRRRAEDPPRDPAPSRRVRRAAARSAAASRSTSARRSSPTTAAKPSLANGVRIPARTLVWTAGVRANPLLAELDLPLDERGRVVVDETLRVEGSDDIWALGDCAAVPNTKTPGMVDPPTCQHALRQARRLAKNLTGTPKPYGYRCSARSRRSGTSRASPRSPACTSGASPAGSSRGRITSTSSRSSRRKLRVVADWTVALFFRRDIVELSMLGHPRKLGDD